MSPAALPIRLPISCLSFSAGLNAVLAAIPGTQLDEEAVLLDHHPSFNAAGRSLLGPDTCNGADLPTQLPNVDWSPTCLNTTYTAIIGEHQSDCYGTGTSGTTCFYNEFNAVCQPGGVWDILNGLCQGELDPLFCCSATTIRPSTVGSYGELHVLTRCIRHVYLLQWAAFLRPYRVAIGI